MLLVLQVSDSIVLLYNAHNDPTLLAPTRFHSYGYIPMRNVSSLISGVAVFFLGAGFTFYHSVLGLLLDHSVESVQWVSGVQLRLW